MVQPFQLFFEVPSPDVKRVGQSPQAREVDFMPINVVLIEIPWIGNAKAGGRSGRGHSPDG